MVKNACSLLASRTNHVELHVKMLDFNMSLPLGISLELSLGCLPACKAGKAKNT